MRRTLRACFIDGTPDLSGTLRQRERNHRIRKRRSLVAPMNTSPPAVTMGPALPVEPVFRLPSGRASVIPSVVCQAISPVFAFTANKRPHGGFWHGQFPRVRPLASLAGALKL
jgi:hypothetical protein